MRFDFLTIFPAMFDSYLKESILARAEKKKLVSFHAYDLRKWANDKHNKVDDKPFGGGPGMVMKVEPIYRAVQALTTPSRSPSKEGEKKQTRVILLSAKGKQFVQADAVRLAKKYQRLIFICGRYEGVDERVADHIADEELSIGPYVLTGGELPAMVIADAVSRHLPGVLGKAESLLEESFSQHEVKPRTTRFNLVSGFKEYPQYTRPEVFSPKKGVHWRVPKILLSGDHKKIAAWRAKQSGK